VIYLYLKAFHLISVIAWMVGLLYLPRLFVYHADSRKDTISYEVFLLMEKRLIRVIMLPSMILSLVFGIAMIYINSSILHEGYFHIKLFLLIILFGIHGYFVFLYKQFEEGKNEKTAKYFRLINEIPTVLMIIIIILVVVKPNLL